MRLTSLLSGALLTASVSFAACANNPTPPDALPATSEAPTPGVTSAELEAALRAALLDEYRAEASYQAVLADLGSIRPFSNIVEAEKVHASEILALYTAHGLTPPANPYLEGEPVAHFDTRVAACQAGVQGEIANIAIYAEQLDKPLPSDVRTVFLRLQDASRSRHLPAFERCSSGMGGPGWRGR